MQLVVVRKFSFKGKTRLPLTKLPEDDAKELLSHHIGLRQFCVGVHDAIDLTPMADIPAVVPAKPTVKEPA